MSTRVLPAKNTKSERIEDMYIGFESDDDISVWGEESHDEDFRYERGATDEEDENTSDDEDSGSEEDERDMPRA